jgi:hypothetical protein
MKKEKPQRARKAAVWASKNLQLGNCSAELVGRTTTFSTEDAFRFAEVVGMTKVSK